MAFKMKAGSEGPMKKNYPAAFKMKDGKMKPKNCLLYTSPSPRDS